MPVVTGGAAQGREIKLRRRYRFVVNGNQKSPASGHAGVNQHRGETNRERKQFAQEQTRKHQMVMVVDAGTGHRRFVRADSL